MKAILEIKEVSADGTMIVLIPMGEDDIEIDMRIELYVDVMMYKRRRYR